MPPQGPFNFSSAINHVTLLHHASFRVIPFWYVSPTELKSAALSLRLGDVNDDLKA